MGQLESEVKGYFMFNKEMSIAGYDDEIATAIAKEETRQEEHIELIASVSYLISF